VGKGASRVERVVRGGGHAGDKVRPVVKMQQFDDSLRDTSQYHYDT
jgi:hypothetical protein